MGDRERREPEVDIVEAIYDSLEQGDPERAHDLAARALEEEADDDPVLRFLAGIALLELDSIDKAVASLSRAVELDPDDPEFRANLALALFRACRFDDALGEARRALEADDGLPDAHHVIGLALERAGRFDEADSHFSRATAIDPEAFPSPARMDHAEFERLVGESTRTLPERFRRHLDDVTVIVEDLPADEILFDEQPPLEPELLGLFVGVPLGLDGALSPGGELPPRILLFQRNLERCFSAPDELRAEIRTTLYHELGHYLGMEEDDLEQADMA